MNFSMDEQSIPMLKILVNSGNCDTAKPLIKTLANEAKQYLDFFEPMSVDEMRVNGWIEKYAYMIQRTKDELTRLAANCKDEAFTTEITDMLKQYTPKAN
jgi:hypothetical protein